MPETSEQTPELGGQAKKVKDFLDLIESQAETLPDEIRAVYSLVKIRSKEMEKVRGKVIEVLLCLATDNENINQHIRLWANEILFDVIASRQAIENKSTAMNPEQMNKMTIEQLFSKVKTGGVLTRVRHILINSNIKTVEDLLEYGENDLLKLHNFGRKCLKLIRDSLKEKGIKLKQWTGKRPGPE